MSMDGLDSEQFRPARPDYPSSFHSDSIFDFNIDTASHFMHDQEPPALQMNQYMEDSSEEVEYTQGQQEYSPTESMNNMVIALDHANISHTPNHFPPNNVQTHFVVPPARQASTLTLPNSKDTDKAKAASTCEKDDDKPSLLLDLLERADTPPRSNSPLPPLDLRKRKISAPISTTLFSNLSTGKDEPTTPGTFTKPNEVMHRRHTIDSEYRRYARHRKHDPTFVEYSPAARHRKKAPYYEPMTQKAIHQPSRKFGVFNPNVGRCFFPPPQMNYQQFQQYMQNQQIQDLYRMHQLKQHEYAQMQKAAAHSFMQRVPIPKITIIDGSSTRIVQPDLAHPESIPPQFFRLKYPITKEQYEYYVQKHAEEQQKQFEEKKKREQELQKKQQQQMRARYLSMMEQSSFQVPPSRNHGIFGSPNVEIRQTPKHSRLIPSTCSTAIQAIPSTSSGIYSVSSTLPSSSMAPPQQIPQRNVVPLPPVLPKTVTSTATHQSSIMESSEGSEVLCLSTNEVAASNAPQDAQPDRMEIDAFGFSSDMLQEQPDDDMFFSAFDALQSPMSVYDDRESLVTPRPEEIFNRRHCSHF